MGLMEKLRGGTKYTIWILIISFGLLWVLADTQVFDAVMLGPAAMGEVKGQPISYQEFNERLNLYTEQHRERTGEAPDMEMRAMYEESVWEELVLNKVLQHKMNEMGLTVTDEELVQMVTGDNPVPFIRQQFGLEDGTIDRVALRNAIESPENRDIWLIIERQLREQRRHEKLSKYLESSLEVSDFEIEREFLRQNNQADFRYVRFPYSEVDETQIEVTDSEVRSYYRANQDRFRRNKNWRISYVEFPKDPTPEDSLRALNELNNLRNAFQATDNDSLFLQDNQSQTSYFTNFMNPTEIRPEHLSVFELSVGEVSEPYMHGGRAHMVKKLEERDAGQDYIRARQIQLNFTTPDREDIEEDANDIAQRARNGNDFQRLAQMYSDDTRSARIGGDIGYFSREDKPQPVADAAFQAEPGSIIGPIEADNSFFILQILDRTNQEVRFADMSIDVEADPMATIEAQAREADDFAEFARLDGFQAEADRGNYTIQEAIATEGNPYISGLGQSRLVIAELRNMRRGQISDVIETDHSFVVIRVEQITPEGVRPLDEVRPQVESAIRNQKRRQILANQINEALAQHSTIEALAEAEGKELLSAENVRQSAVSIPNLGREPKVIGTVFGLNAGELSRAVQGESAVFVVHVDDRRDIQLSELTADERDDIREQLNQRRSREFTQIWAERIKAGVDIKDFRHLRDGSL